MLDRSMDQTQNCHDDIQEQKHFISINIYGRTIKEEMLQQSLWIDGRRRDSKMTRISGRISGTGLIK